MRSVLVSKLLDTILVACLACLCEILLHSLRKILMYLIQKSECTSVPNFGIKNFNLKKSTLCNVIQL